MLSWNSFEIENECQNRMYNMAGLFDNIYDRSCKSQCQPGNYDTVVLSVTVAPSITRDQRRALGHKIENVLRQHDRNRKRSAKLVHLVWRPGLSKRPTSNFNRRIQVPFAGLQFCQINGESRYSPWTCLDSSAKASLIGRLRKSENEIMKIGNHEIKISELVLSVCCIIISLMALASVVSNILVLKIYCSRKRLRSAIGKSSDKWFKKAR